MPSSQRTRKRFDQLRIGGLPDPCAVDVQSGLRVPRRKPHEDADVSEYRQGYDTRRHVNWNDTTPDCQGENTNRMRTRTILDVLN